MALLGNRVTIWESILRPIFLTPLSFFSLLISSSWSEIPTSWSTSSIYTFTTSSSPLPAYLYSPITEDGVSASEYGFHLVNDLNESTASVSTFAIVWTFISYYSLGYSINYFLFDMERRTIFDPFKSVYITLLLTKFNDVSGLLSLRTLPPFLMATSHFAE